MAFAVTAIADATNTTTGTRTITVPAGGVPSGALIVISVANASDAAPNAGSVADAGSNTYTFQEGASNNNVSAEGFVALYTAPCTTPLTSTQLITYTKPTSGTQTRVNGIYVTGHATSNPVDTAAGTSNYGSSTTPTVTSGTAAVADSLNIGAVTTEVTGATINQPGGSWTSYVNGTTTVELGGAYQVASGTGGLTYNPTFNSTHLWATAIIVISPPVAAASLAIAITESADSVAATLNSVFAALVAITESADIVAATLNAASEAGGSSRHPYQPILTVGRMMGR